MKREKSDVVYMRGARDAGTRLTRILPTANDKWNEAWLQRLLFEHPELLPIAEFEPQFGSIIPLAREVGVPNGSIDNLYITASAQLVIVETKLWKNPEAHREVIAQIMQYATAVSTWDYNQLDHSVSAARQEPHGAIERLMASHLKQQGMEMHLFQEELLRSLRAGRFLLLIVGDRISPNVVLLSGVVHSKPGMEFGLGLVELRIYALNNDRDWPLIVVPDVVGRTVEETRAIVRIEHDAPRPTVTLPDPAKERAARGKVTIETLAAQLPPPLKPAFDKLVEEWMSKGRHISLGNVGVAFHIPSRGKTIGMFEVYPHKVSGFTRKRVGPMITQGMFDTYVASLKGAPAALRRLGAGKPYISLRALPSEEFAIILKANSDMADAVAGREAAS